MEASYLDRWVIEKENIGEGGQGKVHLVRRRLPNDIEKTLVEGIDSYDAEVKRRQFQLYVRAIVAAADAFRESNMGALKVLHQPEDAVDPESATERMKSEIRSMQLNLHPNLLKLLDTDLGVDSDTYVAPSARWYVTQYHPGGTLDKATERFKGNALSALKALRPVVEAVAALHERQLVHRDIKPANIFIASDGQLVLGDFGLVYEPKDERMTRAFDNVGSTDWQPLWARGRRLDKVNPTFDIFALGKVLWSMISGDPTLPVWYFRRPQFDLELRFPNRLEMKLVNGLLSRIVVEDEEECREPDATALLSRFDEFIDRLQTRIEPFANNRERICRVCGLGFYSRLMDKTDLEALALLELGKTITCSTKVKSLLCDYCGHMQFFGPVGGEEGRAWQHDPSD